MSVDVDTGPAVIVAPHDKLRLTVLRDAVNETEQQITVMRVFTDGTAGLRSELSAREVAERLEADHGGPILN